MTYQYDLYIDPGHGGSDPGANGFGVKEKDWTLKISLYQYERLKELGVKVAISRTTDKTLSSGPRTSLIKNKARYCMSNHWNAFNGKARGVEVIHSVWTDDKLARRFANAICEVSGLPFRRVFSKQADWTSRKLDYYYMCRETGNTETIIVEYGFIDNKGDNAYYKNEENFYKVAERVVEEWCKVLGVKYVAPKQEGGLSVEDKKRLEQLEKEVKSLQERLTRQEKLPDWMYDSIVDVFDGIAPHLKKPQDWKRKLKARDVEVNELLGMFFLAYLNEKK